MNIKRKIFSILISAYPKSYRKHFKESLLQTFDDMHADVAARNVKEVDKLEWFIIKDAVASIPMQYINYFEETMKIKIGRNLALVVLGALLIVLVVGIQQAIVLQKAHSTFDNYYAFRGCAQLIEKADTYGTCKIASGAIIKIVEIGNKWYLDGDGPGIW